MAGGFAKDALGDMLGSLQGRVESLQRQSSTGKILPCALTLHTSTSNDVSPTVTFEAEFYRHADFVQCWFATVLPAGFTPGAGAFMLSAPWQLKAPTIGSGLVGSWRGIDASGGVNATGEVWVASQTDGRVYLWYVATPPVGAYQFVGSTTPWTWAAGDTLQGQFAAHVLPGF